HCVAYTEGAEISRNLNLQIDTGEDIIISKGAEKNTNGYSAFESFRK
ncbi:hypothetical protein LCGC14_1774380, partial [marine sediment metagenome]